MEEDGFFWWKERLRIIKNFYHLYRLDHIIGFFRIWAIPYGDIAKNGSFIPADESRWCEQGRRLLTKILELSPALPIGEDLGFFHILPEMFDCMIDMGIAGTKVLRWHKIPGGPSFLPLENIL